MNNIPWILLSLLLHVFLAGALWYSSQETPSSQLTEVIDLTWHQQSLPAHKFSSTTVSSKPAPTKVATAATAEENTLAKNPSLDATSDDTTNSPNNLQGPTSGVSELTRLPRVGKEVKATYPEQAKQARIDGPVILDVVIDQHGKVREVQLVSGPGYGLNESAMEALKKFEFIPGQKGNDLVAVKIRYTYRFKLGVN